LSIKSRLIVGLKHLPNVETQFYCPQAFLSLDFQCRDGVSGLERAVELRRIASNDAAQMCDSACRFINGLKAQGTKTKDAKVLFYGAGSSAVGVANMIATLIQKEGGLSEKEAKEVSLPLLFLTHASHTADIRICSHSGPAAVIEASFLLRTSLPWLSHMLHTQQTSPAFIAASQQ